MKQERNNLLYAPMIGELSGSYYKNDRAKRILRVGIHFPLYRKDNENMCELTLSSALKAMMEHYARNQALVSVNVKNCYLPTLAALTLSYLEKDHEKGLEELKEFCALRHLRAKHVKEGEIFFNMMYYLLHGYRRKRVKEFYKDYARSDTPLIQELSKMDKLPLEEKYLKISIALFMQSTGFVSGLHQVDQLGEDTDVYGFYTSALLGSYYKNIEESLIAPIEERMRMDELAKISFSYPTHHYHLKFHSLPIYFKDTYLHYSYEKKDYVFGEDTPESIRKSYQMAVMSIERKRKYNFPMEEQSFPLFALEFACRLRSYTNGIITDQNLEEIMTRFLPEVMACYLDDYNISKTLSLLLNGYHCDDWNLPTKR